MRIRRGLDKRALRICPEKTNQRLCAADVSSSFSPPPPRYIIPEGRCAASMEMVSCLVHGKFELYFAIICSPIFHSGSCEAEFESSLLMHQKSIQHCGSFSVALQSQYGCAIKRLEDEDSSNCH